MTANPLHHKDFSRASAAHNPVVDVCMRTVLPNTPCIIIAFDQLAKRGDVATRLPNNSLKLTRRAGP